MTGKSVLQGPPGTGKTSTVIAMISSLLQAIQPTAGPNLKQYLPTTSLGKRDEAGQAATKVRILVCAQSNAAIDELVMRLADPGIIGADGRYRYGPAFSRNYLR